MNKLLADLRIAVLYGGVSPERDISLLSGKEVIDVLATAGYQVIAVDTAVPGALEEFEADVAFIALHGGDGEGGQVQALLEERQIPYTGSSAEASELALDKMRSKAMWQSMGLPVAEASLLTEADCCLETLKQQFNDGKIVIKPIDGGSSLGVSIIDLADIDDLGLQQAWQVASRPESGSGAGVMVEQFIEGSEITFSIVGDKVLPAIEIVAAGKFYDYHAKYWADDTEYLVCAETSAIEEGRILAQKAYSALGGRDIGRIDFIYSKERGWYLMEVNTVPGLTQHSLVPKACSAVQVHYLELVEQVVSMAIDRKGYSRG